MSALRGRMRPAQCAECRRRVDQVLAHDEAWGLSGWAAFHGAMKQDRDAGIVPKG